MITLRNWTAATLISLGLLSSQIQASEVDQATIEATKAKAAALKEENEALAARIKELEAKAFTKDADAEDLDQKIQLIKARLETDK